MESGGNLLPAKEHDGYESRFHKESQEALNGQRSAENIAHKPWIIAPVRSKFELKDDASSNTHCEVNTEKQLPELGSGLPKLFARAVIARLHDAHDEGKSQCQRHEQPVIDGCQGELRTRPVDHVGIDG